MAAIIRAGETSDSRIAFQESSQVVLITDQAGRPVPNGIYFARFETDNRSSNRALLVLR